MGDIDVALLLQRNGHQPVYEHVCSNEKKKHVGMLLTWGGGGWLSPPRWKPMERHLDLNSCQHKQPVSSDGSGEARPLPVPAGARHGGWHVWDKRCARWKQKRWEAAVQMLTEIHPNAFCCSGWFVEAQEDSMFLNGSGFPGHVMLMLAHCCYVSEIIWKRSWQTTV